MAIIKDSKSLEAGSIPATPIRFTRGYQKIVDKEDPQSKATENPYCYVWDKPLDLILKDISCDKISSGNSKWDYIEFFSPNPTPGGLHLGHEINLLLGYVFSRLLEIRPHSWINDLGLNFCRGLLGNKKNLDYNAIDSSYDEQANLIRKRIFSEGLTEQEYEVRDSSVYKNLEAGNRLVPLNPVNLYESSFKKELKTLLEAPKDRVGRPTYQGLVVGTSSGCPLYAGSDLVYRKYLLETYKKPILLVGKDQQNYHKNLNKFFEVKILTNPSVKTCGEKLSKRKGHNFSVEKLIEDYRTNPCSNTCKFHELSSQILLIVFILEATLNHRDPVLNLQERWNCSKVAYWLNHLKSGPVTPPKLTRDLIAPYKLYFEKWSYLQQVVCKSARDLDPGFILKFLEETYNLEKKIQEPWVTQFQRYKTYKVFEYLLGKPYTRILRV